MSLYLLLAAPSSCLAAIYPQFCHDTVLTRHTEHWSRLGAYYCRRWLRVLVIGASIGLHNALLQMRQFVLRLISSVRHKPSGLFLLKPFANNTTSTVCPMGPEWYRSRYASLRMPHKWGFGVPYSKVWFRISGFRFQSFVNWHLLLTFLTKTVIHCQLQGYPMVMLSEWSEHA